MTVSATVQVNSITFTGTGYTVGGTALTLTGTGGNITTTSAGAISAPIVGSVGLTKLGAATLTLSGDNTYTGSTIVNGGTLALGASNVLPTTPVVLSGGTLSTLGLADTTGTLQLISASTINNGALLSFANSSATFGTSVLTILNWTSGTIRFGTNNTGLTSGQLSNISAFYPGGASAGPVTLDATGLLVTVPEPGAVITAMLLLGGIGWRERRHFIRRRPTLA